MRLLGPFVELVQLPIFPQRDVFLLEGDSASQNPEHAAGMLRSSFHEARANAASAANVIAAKPESVKKAQKHQHNKSSTLLRHLWWKNLALFGTSLRNPSQRDFQGCAPRARCF
jgi:hypothetical protein